MVRTLLPLDRDYPSALRALKSPREITVQGTLEPGQSRVAIVGSRAAHPDAERYAFALAAALADNGLCVVSGGAEGIDGAAHRGALDAGGTTWVVAPFGHGAPCFPESHAQLFADVVAAGGAMVYVLPAGQRARNFRARNHLMVALVDAVVVIQAGAVSGTLNTAHQAQAQGRPLWVAPPAPWLPGFEGSRALLRGPNARPLWSANDLLDAFSRPSPSRPATPERPSRAPPVDDAARAVLACLTTPRCKDELVEATGWSPSRLAEVLFALQLDGLVVEDEGGRICAREPRTS